MKNLTRYLQRARRGAQMTLCWVVVAVTALCGMPTAGFALQDESRDELYGDVVNPLTITVNDRDCTFVDIDDGKLEGRTSMYDNVSFYTAAVKKVLPNWASLAYNILGYGGGDDSGDFLYWDHAGKGFEKDFGKGAVMKLGESGAHVSVETVPTGCLSLDLALGLGGVPKGRVIEVYGPESSGKTTVALHMISEVQKRGGIAGFIDAEHALDPVYAKNIGVDIDELYISQPDSGDQALEIAETMVRSGAIDIIVIDSVAALVPKQEIEGDMGDSHVGLQARLMSQALRKLTPVISKSNCVVIFINQLREKVGVMFGNPETTTGGRALKFYASVRMDVRRIETLKQNGEIVGNRTRIKIVKNKIAPPFKEAEFDIMFGKGISREGDILDLASKIDIVKKSGAWYAYEGDKIGQGRENAKSYLESHPEVMEEIIIIWMVQSRKMKRKVI